MYPAQWMFRHQLNQRRGNVQRTLPFLGLGVDLPTNLQNSRVSAILGGNVLQLLVGFEMITQLDPALRG
jgi:hypothetical protein